MIIKATIALALALLVASCSGTDPVDPPTNRFVVDGLHYSGTAFIGNSDDSAGKAFQLGEIVEIWIDGSEQNFDATFQIRLSPAHPFVGTYIIPGVDFNPTWINLVVWKNGSRERYHAVSGTINIDEWPAKGLGKGRFTGSFSNDTGSAGPVLQITNGSFVLRRV